MDLVASFGARLPERLLGLALELLDEGGVGSEGRGRLVTGLVESTLLELDPQTWDLAFELRAFEEAARLDEALAVQRDMLTHISCQKYEREAAPKARPDPPTGEPSEPGEEGGK